MNTFCVASAGEEALKGYHPNKMINAVFVIYPLIKAPEQVPT